MEDSKRCIGCGETKPLTEFYRASTGYYQSRCKPCNCKQVGAHRKANPEKRLAYQRQYRAANRNKPREKARQIREGMVRRSRQRGFGTPEWSIDEIEQIIQGNCSRTGLAFRFDQSQGRLSPWTPVPDRIDSSRGYTRDNVQWVCYMYNVMKSDFSQDEVDQFIAAIAPGAF